jgi:type IV secretory pathway VirB4 component
MAKQQPKISTQQFVPFSAIYDDVVVTKKGQFCQILMVNSVNFGLKSDEEQNAIIYQYQSFLNSLTFPIQILMHSKRLDLTSYIKGLEDRVAQEANELIRYQIGEYVDFIGKLISIANIMDKKFFVIVPHLLPPTELGSGGLFASKETHLKVPLKKFLTIKESLAQKTNVVASGLTSMGISSKVLSTKQIIETFYRTYNPEEAMKEGLQDNIEAVGVETIEVAETPAPQAVPTTAGKPPESVKVPIVDSINKPQA